MKATGEQCTGKNASEKGQFMFNIMHVQSFEDLKNMSVDDLKELLDTIESYQWPIIELTEGQKQFREMQKNLE